MKKDKVTNSIISKVIESASIQVLNFIIGIVLARVLSPEDYGVYSILLIFISIGQTVVVAGLNSALIQRDDIKDDDYSTVFTASMLASLVIYLILFFLSSFIAKIYASPMAEKPLKVISLVLFPNALYSVVNARVAKNMEFSLAAKISVAAVVFSGTVSVFLALKAAGVWALVVQQILTYSVMPTIYCIRKKWCPKFKFDFSRFKVLFGFGTKVLVADFINSIYSNVQGMIIGVKYNATALAFFNKGQLLPRTIMQTINGSVECVLFPVYSNIQNSRKKMAEEIIENAKMISFIVYPLMIGLFSISDEVIVLLLTEKWIECAGIVRIFCIAYLFWPIDSMNLQAIKACGNGNAYLKLNFFKKCIATGILSLALFVFKSLETFAISAILIYVSDIIIGSFDMKKEINISLFQEICALWKSLLCSSFILINILLPTVCESTVLTIIYKIVVGIVIYILSSYILNQDIMKKLIRKFSGILKKD